MRAWRLCIVRMTQVCDQRARAAAATTDITDLMMKPEERQKLAATWLALHRKRSSEDDLSWVVAKIWDLCDYAPNEALDFIIEVLKLDVSSNAMAVLSAGPLEGLLRKHGARIMERVERRARSDDRLAELLGYVWQQSVSRYVWSRVQSARQRHLRKIGKVDCA